MAYAIETLALTRTFGDVKAVNALDLAVPVGSVFGFLGPNGAGKTTTIRMLLGLIAADSGRIQLNGVDLTQARQTALSGVGAIVESPALYSNLTGREIMVMAAWLNGRPIKDGLEQLERVSLTDAMNRKVSGYSLGMRQRLALARAMMGEPRLLILDEPTNGLDPAGIADMRELIKALPETLGATVFLSSHLLSEIEQTATDCALVHKGKLVFQDKLSKLADSAPSSVVIETSRPDDLAKRFHAQSLQTRIEGACVYLSEDMSREDRASLNRALLEEGFDVSALWSERATLEDIFLGLTQTQLGAPQ